MPGESAERLCRYFWGTPLFRTYGVTMHLSLGNGRMLVSAPNRGNMSRSDLASAMAGTGQLGPQGNRNASGRFEAALAHPEISRIRRIPDTIWPSPTVSPRHRSAVIAAVLASGWRMVIFPKADTQGWLPEATAPHP